MKLYNTLTRSVEPFKPLNDKNVSLYTCGLTVYSEPHIGNWVAYIYWDLLVRVLQEAGYSVRRVQNITDVGHLTSDEDAGEDKMLKGALREGLSAWQVAEKYIQIADKEAFDQLGLLRPDNMPRATEYIPQQIAFVQELEKRGFTYTISDGVYFDTSKLENYGALAKLDIEGLQFGARVADSGKKNPTDFALWKFSDPKEKRDMEWESPWGVGFPGWHLECSVMARELLGDTIDIHTGGIDHIPVHHTNEIAQTEALTGKPFSRFWLHANHIKVDGTKISKSLGNGYTLNDIRNNGYSLDAFKLMVLSKHYRTEGNFSWEILEASQNRLHNWYAAADLVWQLEKADQTESDQAVITALEDDLNSPEAVSLIDQALDKTIRDGLAPDQAFIEHIERLFGLELISGDITDEQKEKLHSRQRARENKNWSESDRLRDELKVHGIEVSDTEHGQIWHRTKR